MLSLSDRVCANLAEARLREWIETSGTGGYASSTITGMNTRRYHGLLVCGVGNLANRFVLLSKLEETIVIRGDKYPLSCNQYPGNVNPEGYRYLKEFRLSPFPKFIYEVAGYRIEKIVFMVHGQNTVAVQYRVFPDQGDVELHIRPMLAYRHFHDLRQNNDDILSDLSIAGKTVRFMPYGEMPPLYMYHSADIFRERGFWYNDFEYREELYRGFDCHENLYNPGYLIYTLYRPQQYDGWVVFSTDPLVDINVKQWKDREIIRRTKLIKNIEDDQSFLEPLVLTADSFIVKQGMTPDAGIIAGYHWFGEWTRDSMIALPGLTLATGRFATAKHILYKTIQREKNGLLPNYYDQNDQPVYTSVDTSLWFLYALYKYLQYTNDYNFVKSILERIRLILDAYMHGTSFGIRMNGLSLIEFTDESLPLTWMDTIDIHGKTSARKGMVVEVNALWYQALRTGALIMERLGYSDDAINYIRIAETVQRNFEQVFWNSELQYLYDFVDGEYQECSLRPNQILSIGLPMSVLPRQYWTSVIQSIEQKLLTPFGLRTLSTDDPLFNPHYRGSEDKRRIAYHQGTVWAWLFGFFISSAVKLRGKNPDTIACLKPLISPFKEHLLVGGIGTISEIFDGSLPYYFRGCISQAWSVGEILRVYGEDFVQNDVSEPIYQIRKVLDNQ